MQSQDATESLIAVEAPTDGWVEFEPYAMSIADIFTAVVAVLAFFFSKHANAKTRLLSSFDAEVSPKANEYTVCLLRLVRATRSLKASVPEQREASYTKLVSDLTDWLNDLDDRYTAFYASLSAWCQQYSVSDFPLVGITVDPIYLRAGTVVVTEVDQFANFDYQHINQLEESVVDQVTLTHDILARVEKKVGGKFLWLF